MRYEPSPSLPPPHSKIGLVHVQYLRVMTAALRAVDYRYGGGSCRTQVQALLSWCDKAFAHSASALVRREFRSAIAELHALAGWTAFDAGLGGSAHRHFHLALDFAEDEDLVANIRYRMGRVHLHHGGPAEALGMFRLAGLVANSHHTNAILAANQAWCYAELGQRVPALALLGRAHDEFARADVDGAAPWAAFFDVPDLAGITGAVYTSLARTVDASFARPAITSLRQAVTGYREDMARSRTFAFIALSLNHLVEGDADEAAAVAGLAVTQTGNMMSARTRKKLEPLRAEADRRRATTVRELIMPLLAAPAHAA
jgi:tetratricopeptide (TPR) repeat protein